MKRTDHIDELNLSVRTRNCLIRHGVTTVGELSDMSNEDITRVRGMGATGLREIINKLIEVTPELPPEGGYIEKRQVLSVAAQEGASEALLKALEGIDEADAEPVKRSEWRHLRPGEWFCDVCGHVIKTAEPWEHPCKDLGINYCEACGSKMTGRKKGGV